MRIRRISNAFQERFADFKDPETDFAISSNPFFCQRWSDVTKIWNQTAIELQCISAL